MPPDPLLWALPHPPAVAALVWTRTVNTLGVMGAFTTDTRPTFAQVIEMIAFVGGEVVGAVGLSLPEVLHSQAHRCVTLGAAAMVERSFFPEQQRNNEDLTAATSFGELYERSLKRLMESAKSMAKSASAGAGMGLGSMKVRSATLVAFEEDLAAQAQP